MSDSHVQLRGAGLALLTEQQHWRDAAGAPVPAQCMQVRIDGAPDVPALQAALDDVALRQPVLATAVAAVPGYHGVRQFPGAHGGPVALRVEASAQSLEAADAQCRQWLAQATPEQAPLRALLQRLDGETWRLTLALARGLADASSLTLLFEQVRQAYVHGPAGADEELAQFEQYLEWRAEVVLDEDAGQAAQYWQAHLGSQAGFQADLPYRRAGEVAGQAASGAGRASASEADGIGLAGVDVAEEGGAVLVGVSTGEASRAGLAGVSVGESGGTGLAGVSVGGAQGAGSAGVHGGERDGAHQAVAAHPVWAMSGLASVEQVEAPLSLELRTGLQALAERHGTDLDTALQAAWWLLLARIGGRSAFIAGWRHDSRADYDFFEHGLGLFEKTLPLQLAFDPQASFETGLAQLASALTQHRTWQEYCPAATPATQPHCGFATGRLPSQDGDWTAQVHAELPPGFELLLHAGQDASGTVQRLSLVFDSRRYGAQAMAGLLVQYQVLLGSLLAAPCAPTAELSLLGDAERERLLAFNPAPFALDPALNLSARIAHWHAHTPDAPALVSGDATLSYAELHRRAQRLAAAMTQRGVTAGQRVGLALPRSANWLVAALATWQVGAAWVALDPQWPVARLAQLLQEAGATLLLAEQTLALDVAQLAVDAFEFDAPAASLTEPAALKTNDLAYVLFTSGSTGTPKAVAVEHGALANYVASASAALDLARCRRFVFSASVVADLGHTALFGALYNGAALHLADDATMQDGQAFARFVEAQAIDCLKIVPSHLAALLDTPAPRLPATLVLGGEALPPAVVERLLHLRPDLRLFNHYGPSEATVGVLVHAIDARDAQAAAVPLTQVLANNQAWVLDSNQRLVATGELGELYLAGAQLARGYLNAAEQQAQAFLDAPQVAGGRLYRTGDLARYRPEGGIVLQGRADQQVKLRGFRVELGEIQAHLAALEGVGEAAVVLDAQGEAQAFVTAVGQAPGEWSSLLKAELERRLPAVMVPRSVQVLARMPRLGNGKIDRQALSAMDLAAAQQAYVAPRDALEQVLATRMAQLLGNERLSVEQDFFAAGGHSLLVIKLVAGIRKLLQCEVHPGVVFDNPSPAALAQALRLQEVAPGQLEKLAQARVRLDAMSPEEKARLLEKAQSLG
ncbi:amino acid adenylation domain-containing protein [Pseudomonas sp. UBA6562]|uniref:non-ribosomal peptide synthetase family protein n=1 Tax=Pseudomonas sp. UBA6562 TaxID=1947332 RepID=UPI0025FC9EE8|nr:amino acid adenylation domain-containing protein [Pseudomonas sp. UBA6562]